MILEYVNKLMDNLPDELTRQKKPIQIDLILGGGAFNGSYILGALFFLKELERKQIIIVKRISTCSISSILGLLYLTDRLDKANELYFDILQDFKNNGNLSKLFQIKQIFHSYLNQDTYQILRKKLYISYNNVQLCKKRVKCCYKNIDDLFETITRSCFVPFMIDFSPAYKNTYIDGILPHFFSKSRRHTRLYLNVYTIDKLSYSFNVKNEKNNYHRLFQGMLDIHEYFIKQTNTIMCSNVDRWNMSQYILYYIYTILEKIIVFFIYIIATVKSRILIEKYDNMKPIIEHIIKYLLHVFCF